MLSIRENREILGLSQRELAARAGVAFRTVQLIESGARDPNLSTLDRILQALGFPEGGLKGAIQRYLSSKDDSVLEVSRGIGRAPDSAWKVRFFDFVDAFRRNPSTELVAAAPDPAAGRKIHALLASTVEALCVDAGIRVPWWCAGVPELSDPWFVSGTENLKAMALMESPVHFRKRNIFVLDDFLDRT